MLTTRDILYSLTTLSSILAQNTLTYTIILFENIEYSKIDFYYISIKDILVNIFTKELSHEAFIKFQNYLGVLSEK